MDDKPENAQICLTRIKTQEIRSAKLEAASRWIRIGYLGMPSYRSANDADKSK